MHHERIAYHNAKSRCQNPRATGYQNYGGRGVQFLFSSVEQWFKELGKRPSRRHTVDRINNDGHYEPGNVRWATRSDQNRNRRPSCAAARAVQSEAAKKRCTPEWRAAVSARVKKQHVAGKFGKKSKQTGEQ